MRTPRPTQPTIAELVAADGFDAHEAALREWLSQVDARGRSPVLLAIVADPEAPEVARLRALGRLMVEAARPVSPVVPTLADLAGALRHPASVDTLATAS